MYNGVRPQTHKEVSGRTLKSLMECETIFYCVGLLHCSCSASQLHIDTFLMHRDCDNPKFPYKFGKHTLTAR